MHLGHYKISGKKVQRVECMVFRHSSGEQGLHSLKDSENVMMLFKLKNIELATRKELPHWPLLQHKNTLNFPEVNGDQL